jgi:hypothetical protein
VFFLSQNQQNQQKLFSCWGKLANRRLSGDGTVVPSRQPFYFCFASFVGFVIIMILCFLLSVQRFPPFANG